jgi:hypothetical protein
VDYGKVRLIIEARRANACFRPPPKVSLPTPDMSAALCLPPAGSLFVGKIDLDNFYHRLALPSWLRPFFALPAVPASLFGLESGCCGRW